MKLFRERVTPVENIAFMAIMAAFVAIISLIGALLPLSSIFIMVLVPLAASAVALFCKARYLPIFFLGCFGLAMALSAWNFAGTVFYVLPSLLTGLCYGLLWKLKTPSSLNIFVTSLLGFLLFMFSLRLAGWMAGIDMQVFLLSLIKKENSESAPIVFPLFCFAYSVAQIGIAHIFLTYELSHVGKRENGEGKFRPFHPLISVGFSILSAICVLFSLKTAYFFFGCALFWAVFSLMSLHPKTHWATWVVLGVGVFASILIFAATFKKIEGYGGMLLLLVPIAFFDLSSFLNFLLLRKA
ncbi:MAG: hypothetical protein E7179_03725 [Erysipelotrichaceae bacterium]|nr:hypothetical protein [Erysipelotrichaceae bacterium]